MIEAAIVSLNVVNAPRHRYCFQNIESKPAWWRRFRIGAVTVESPFFLRFRVRFPQFRADKAVCRAMPGEFSWSVGEQALSGAVLAHGCAVPSRTSIAVISLEARFRARAPRFATLRLSGGSSDCIENPNKRPKYGRLSCVLAVIAIPGMRKFAQNANISKHQPENCRSALVSGKNVAYRRQYRGPKLEPIWRSARVVCEQQRI